MTQTNTVLSDIMEENVLWVNRDIAHKYGLKNNKKVKKPP